MKITLDEMLEKKDKKDIEEILTNPTQFFIFAAKVHPYVYQQNFLNSESKRIAVRSGRQIGKCLSSDTLILCSDGSLKKIQDLPNNIEVVSLNKDLHLVKTHAIKVERKPQKTFRVITKTGREVKTTIEHPFLVKRDVWSERKRRKKMEWIPLKDLKVNDRIAVPTRLPFFGNNETDIEEVKLLAYMIGEGSTSSGNFSFTNTNQKMVEEFSSCCKKFGVDVRKRGIMYYPTTHIKNRYLKNHIKDIIKSHGLMDKIADEKFIPDMIFKLKREQLSIFISRLYACDGWFCKNEIGYSSASKKLIKQLQHLLLRFEIVSYINERKKGNKSYYCLHIGSKESVLTFLKEIGWFRENKDNIKQYYMGKKSRLNYYYKNDIFFDKIKKIIPLEVEKTWDLEVPEYQNFVANDIIVHNTTMCGVKALWSAFMNSNYQVLILAPSQRQSSLLFWNIKEMVAENPFIKSFVTRETMTQIHFDNGSEIHCLPAGSKRVSERIRGFSPNLIIMDEAAFIPDEVLDAIEPSLAHTQGDIVYTSTPYGKRGFFWEAFKPDSGFDIYHVKSEECPHITKEFLKDKKDKLNENVYKQEYEGGFTEESDVFLTRSLILKCVDDITEYDKPLAGMRYFLGVDCARMGSDETVYVIVEVGRIHYRVVKIISTKKKPTTDIIGRIKGLHERWKFEMIHIDATNVGGPVYDVLIQEDYPMMPAKFASIKFKEELYNNLKTLMEHDKIRFPSDKKLIEQMSGLICRFTMQGMSIQPPEKGHDDYPDALALAVRSLTITDFEPQEKFYMR